MQFDTDDYLTRHVGRERTSRAHPTFTKTPRLSFKRKKFCRINHPIKHPSPHPIIIPLIASNLVQIPKVQIVFKIPAIGGGTRKPARARSRVCFSRRGKGGASHWINRGKNVWLLRFHFESKPIRALNRSVRKCCFDSKMEGGPAKEKPPLWRGKITAAAMHANGALRVCEHSSTDVLLFRNLFSDRSVSRCRALSGERGGNCFP